MPSIFAACPAEAAQLVAPLAALVARVTGLLEQWPENQQLARVVHVCNALARVPVGAPHMRVLTGLETLLARVDEWEAVASRDVSLADASKPLSGLVKQWRAVELASWQSVLTQCEAAAVRDANRWWFRLFELVDALPPRAHDGAAWVMIEGRKTASAQALDPELFSVLDQFLRTATLGDFARRVELIAAFGEFCIRTRRAQQGAALIHLAHYYRQWDADVHACMERHRGAAQTKLADLVKVSKWDDRSFFALKESAEKSHRAVHKCARAYDEALAIPAHPTLESAAASLASEDPAALAKSADALVVRASSPLMLEPQPPACSAQHKARRIVAAHVLPAMDALAASCAPAALHEAMAERLRALAGQPVQVKKRALVDFLGVLKDEGVLKRADALPAELADHRCVLATPLLRLQGASPHGLAWAERADVLFYRCVGAHVRLAAFSAKGVHADIAREQYAKTLVASSVMLHMLLQHRVSLVALAHARAALVGLARALDRVARDAEGGGGGVIAEDALAPVRAEANALEETARDALALIAQFETPSAAATAARAGITAELDAIRAALAARGDCVVPSTSDLALANGLRARMVDLHCRLRDLLAAQRVPVHAMRGLSPMQTPQAAAAQLVAAARPGSVEAADACVTTCQLVVQVMAAGAESTDDGGAAMGAQHAQLVEWAQAVARLNASTACDVMASALRSGACAGSEAARVLPFAAAAVEAVDALVGALASWHAECARAMSMVGRVALSLCQHGFCRPPPPAPPSESRGEEDDAREGTGMGEGRGEKDVTDEIEDEEQLLGLRDDAPRADEGERPPPENAESGLEMQGEFDGDLQDVEGKSEDGDDEEDAKDEDEELDREMGDAGPESTVVDEKLWGSDDDDDDESIAKDERTEQRGAGEEPMPANTDEVMDASGDDEDARREGGVREPERTESADGEDEEKAMDAKPEETMEDDHGIAPKGGDDADLDAEAEAEADEAEGAMEDAAMDDGEDESDAMEEEPGGAVEDAEQQPGGSGDDDDDAAMDVEAPKPEAAAASDQDAMQPETVSAEEEQATQAPSDPAASDANAPAADTHANSAGEGASRKPSAGVPLARAPEQSAPAAMDRERGGGAMQRGASQGADDGETPERGGDDNDGDGGNAEEAEEPNPWRDAGRADEAWARRLRVLHGLEGERKPPAGGRMHEFAPEGEAQTLDAAREDEAAVLPAQAADDDRDAEAEQRGDGVDGMDDDGDESDADMGAPQGPSKAPIAPPLPAKENDDAAQPTNTAAVQPLLPPPQQQQQPMSLVRSLHAASVIVAAPPSAQASSPPAADEPQSGDAIVVEAPLEAATLAGRGAWQAAMDATDEMAHRLCEQLRLILEPTLKSKLKGDYRTGKRLNMRRIIPYVASQFKKDKIWMRRTQPAKRQYQVGLVIDDSQSMRPVGDLALASVALISRGLNMLEVGEIGVWSFGNEVRTLHRLQDAFNDEAGCAVASQMTYEQRSTDVEGALKAVVGAMAERAAELKDVTSPRQLVFVVSDGRFDSGLRAKVKQWTAFAREKGQLVACVIVEPATGESILDVRQVTFGAGGGMKVGKYLEDYPFEYYIVLRDQNVLPEVLADALKQWFELIADAAGAGE